MKITVTKTYELTYLVQYFHNSEGGMESDRFRSPVKTLEEALDLLELAKVANPGDGRYGPNQWVIVIEVETKLTKS